MVCASSPRTRVIAAALRELGRLERTLFTLDWIEDPELRRRTSRELNWASHATAWRGPCSFTGWEKSATALTRTSSTRAG